MYWWEKNWNELDSLPGSDHAHDKCIVKKDLQNVQAFFLLPDKGPVPVFGRILNMNTVVIDVIINDQIVIFGK